MRMLFSLDRCAEHVLVDDDSADALYAQVNTYFSWSDVSAADRYAEALQNPTIAKDSARFVCYICHYSLTSLTNLSDFSQPIPVYSRFSARPRLACFNTNVPIAVKSSKHSGLPFPSTYLHPSYCPLQTVTPIQYLCTASRTKDDWVRGSGRLCTLAKSRN
jgi:hypothetical protein